MIGKTVKPKAIDAKGLCCERIGRYCLCLSRFAFFATIVALPLPMFWEIVPRHVGSVETQFRSVVLYLSDIPLVIAVSSWAIAHALWPSRPIHVGPWYVAGPTLTLLVLTALSPMWARAMPIAAETAMRTAAASAFYLMAASEPRAQILLAKGLVVSLLVHAPVALGQFLTQAPVGLGLLGEIPWYENTPGAWLRGYGLSAHPNILGGFLMLGLLSFIGMALTGKGPRLKPLSLRIRDLFHVTVGNGIFSLGAAGLLSTFSRSAWFGLGSALLYLGVVAWRKNGDRFTLTILLWSVLVLVVTVSVFLIFYPRMFVTRLLLPMASVFRGEGVAGAHLEMGVLEERGRLHKAALALIAEAPLLGVGAGNFSVAYYQQTGPSEPYRLYQPVHNVPLLVTAELGPLGGIAWLFLAVAPLVAVLRSPSRMANLWPYIWAAAILGVLIVSGFDFYFWGREQGRVLFWSLVGSWVVSRRRSGDSLLI